MTCPRCGSETESLTVMVKGTESVTICPGCAPTIGGSMEDLLEGTMCRECESSVASIITADGRMICSSCFRIEEGLQSQAQVDHESASPRA